MLLGAGADVNKARTDDGETPLTISAYSLDDAAALAMVQLLAMAAANLAHTTTRGETAAVIAARRNKPLTAAWLESVAGFSPIQVCVSLGNGAELEALLRRQECDPFARLPGTPAALFGRQRPSICRCAACAAPRPPPAWI